MGIVISRCYTKHYDNPIQLRAKIVVLEEEVKELKKVKVQQARASEKQAEMFACKKEEWKRERRKNKEEAACMKKMLKEDEDKIRSLQVEVMASREDSEAEWRHWMESDYVVEQMKEEKAQAAQREVAVEKWKQLYLTIKTELDDLIHRTREGGTIYMAAEEGLRNELKAKEETIEALRSRLSTMEKEGVKREREIDILRQSLRILSNTKRNGMRRSFRTRLLF